VEVWDLLEAVRTVGHPALDPGGTPAEVDGAVVVPVDGVLPEVGHLLATTEVLTLTPLTMLISWRTKHKYHRKSVSNCAVLTDEVPGFYYGLRPILCVPFLGDETVFWLLSRSVSPRTVNIVFQTAFYTHFKYEFD
jgi:hypothetical protein